METHFADPLRSGADELQQDIRKTTGHPILDGLMGHISGLFAVLNKHRQIISLNQHFLKMLGIGDASEVLGLRLGESIKCVHSERMDGGCGTSEYCSTCGAAIAMVSSLASESMISQTCSVTVNISGRQKDLFFKVQCSPITIDNEKFLLLFMEDITQQQIWAALENVFFHDISNVLNGVCGLTEILKTKSAGLENEGLIENLFLQTSRLSQEFSIQRALSLNNMKDYTSHITSTAIKYIVEESLQSVRNHPSSAGRQITGPGCCSKTMLHTDSALLIRILVNMLLNALEATKAGGEVRINVQESPQSHVIFSVWNGGVIPPPVAKRIFQRHYSTKIGQGRGLGTYSMKFFGEDVLGGKVYFTSSEPGGTFFFIKLHI